MQEKEEMRGIPRISDCRKTWSTASEKQKNNLGTVIPDCPYMKTKSNGKENIEFSLPLLAFCEIVLYRSSQSAFTARRIQSIRLRFFKRLLLFPTKPALRELYFTPTKTISQNIRGVFRHLLSVSIMSTH